MAGWHILRSGTLSPSYPAEQRILKYRRITYPAKRVLFHQAIQQNNAGWHVLLSGVVFIKP
jgi:hypothetical protein